MVGIVFKQLINFLDVEVLGEVVLYFQTYRSSVVEEHLLLLIDWVY